MERIGDRGEGMMDVKAGDLFVHKLSKQILIALSGQQTDGQFSARLWDAQAKTLVGPLYVWTCEVEPARGRYVADEISRSQEGRRP